MDKTVLYIVVPCYNEQEVLPETVRRLGAFLDENADLLAENSRVVFVDDGSRDGTWDIIRASANDARFEGISLAHNSGHQNAVWAGMEYARGKCDACISIDADLQDDVNTMRVFVQKLQAGADVVYGVRSSRKTDSVFKRLSAEAFYKLMTAMGAESVYNHADFRLLSARALGALMSYTEVNLYLRGMVPLLGFNTEKVYYERAERFAGVSHYPLKKMLALAFQGITSFSVKPIRLIWITGLCVLLASLVMGIIDVCVPGTQTGFAAFSVWFIGGLLLTALGVTGEYAGKIYAETKRRPKYIIKETARRDE
ncbi:MAG: glycosyltransferase family 2 protein [Clostridia bacterium]|nr:glycosyltransferase family 2 protein [Clostridia bacterium]